ncbi:GOSR1 protein, partial [Corythaeola cristata]|nr:GOSR1 protein [Corythaeola cristata]
LLPRSRPPRADLRKQARQLENELDLKLVSFSKLCTSYSSTRDGRRDRYSSDTTPLLNGSSQDRMFETMAVEIEQLLGKLTGINDKMAEYTNSAGVPSLNAALMHTLQRHRDILQVTDAYVSHLSNEKPLEKMFFSSYWFLHFRSYKSGSGVNNRRTELFLKEHEHLRKTGQLPQHSPGFLSSEPTQKLRGAISGCPGRFTTVLNRFPAVNSLIQRINLRKRRDSLILGGIIGICTILLLLYAFH